MLVVVECTKWNGFQCQEPNTTRGAASALCVVLGLPQLRPLLTMGPFIVQPTHARQLPMGSVLLSLAQYEKLQTAFGMTIAFSTFASNLQHYSAHLCRLVRDPHLLAKLKLLSKKFHQIIQGLCPKPPKLVDVKHVCDWSSLRDIPGQHVLVTWEKYSENCKVPHSFEILSWIWEKPWRGEPQIITKTLKKDRLMEYEAGIPYQVPLRDGNGGYLRDDYGDCIPDPETDPSGGNYSHLLFVTNTVTKICKLRVAAYNEYGWSVSSPTEITIGCFGGNTKVQMECGTKFLKDVQVGDKVTTGNGSEVTEVLAVQEMPCFKERWMTAAPGLSLTRGHPVMKDGEWYRADEIFETELVFQEKLYNLCLQTTHTIVIVAANGVQLRCATLGCVCPRLAARDTVSDQKYGSGYRPLVTKHVGCHKQAIK